MLSRNTYRYPSCYKNRYDPEGLKGVRKGISYNAEVENINFPKLMFPNWIIQAENMG